MVTITKNLGILPIYNNITLNIDLTNNSSKDMTILDFTTENNIYIFDIRNHIVPARSYIDINTIIKTVNNNFSPVQRKRIFLNCKMDMTNIEILLNLDYTSVPLYNSLVFKINKNISINRYIITTIEYDYEESIQTEPILILQKLNNIFINQIPKLYKINNYTYSYMFKIDYKGMNVYDNLFLLYYNKKIKIDKLYIRSI